MWQVWQAIRSACFASSAARGPACGAPSWQFVQATFTSGSSCALTSAPPAVRWCRVVWQSTQESPFATWTSTSAEVGATPCFAFGPPPAPRWHRWHISLVGRPTARAAASASTPSAGAIRSRSPSFTTVRL